MMLQRFDYINDRPTEDIEVAFDLDGGGEWVVSFVATVPHYCESEKIFGDLFDCPLAAIDHQSVPVGISSVKEAEIIRRLRTWADKNIPPEQQHTLRHARYPMMSAEIGLQRQILWFISALEERKQRNGLHV
jgi:hypothetical protein